MPTYAYACKDCGHAFDIVQSFSDASLTLCPECGGSLRKKFNSVGVVFKGSGFYRTDSRSSSTVSAGSGAASGSGSSGSDGSATKGAPSAPAAAPAPATSAAAS
ncbi:MAG TPA: FmdB family zinc ribbon protein [Sinomonas sp.]|nr:FmdB family zinc ribbon protein [Sinomonas sp.]